MLTRVGNAPNFRNGLRLGADMGSEEPQRHSLEGVVEHCRSWRHVQVAVGDDAWWMPASFAVPIYLEHVILDFGRMQRRQAVVAVEIEVKPRLREPTPCSQMLAHTPSCHETCASELRRVQGPSSIRHAGLAQHMLSAPENDEPHASPSFAGFGLGSVLCSIVSFVLSNGVRP